MVRAQTLKYWVMLSLCFGCAQKSLRDELNEKREGDGTRNTGPALDHFYIDNPFQKEYPLKNRTFYYKHCQYVNKRTPFPTKDETACTDPPMD